MRGKICRACTFVYGRGRGAWQAKYVPCNELKLNLIYCLSAGMKFMTSNGKGETQSERERAREREREPRFDCMCVVSPLRLCVCVCV